MTGTQRTSPLRAMAWKEWRQQRWIALAMAILPLMAMAVMGLLGENGLAAVIVPLLVTALAPVVLGANAFCGEEDDRSAEFLRTMPLPAARVFGVKAGVVWLLLMVIAACVTAGAAGLRATGIAPYPMAKSGEWLGYVPRAVAVLFAMSLIPAILSPVARRTLTCVLASLVVITVVVVTVFALFGAFTHFDFATGADALRLPALLVAAVMTLAVAGWIACTARRGLSLWAVLLRCAAALALLGLLTAGAPAAAIVYVYGFATPAFYLKRHVVTHIRFSPSPDGEWATGDFWISQHDPRAWVMNVRSGEWRWVNGLRQSCPWGAQPWSPDSRACLVGVNDSWAIPRKLGEIGGGYWGTVRMDHGGCAILDPATGQRKTLHEIRHELPERFDQAKEVPYVLRWMDVQTIVMLEQDRCAVDFLHIRNGVLSRCGIGEGLGFKAKVIMWEPSCGGLFLAKESPPAGQGKTVSYALLRFRPEAALAEVVSVWQVPAGAPVKFLFSPDERRILIASVAGMEQRVEEMRLLSTDKGAQPELLHVDTGTAPALEKGDWHVCDFAPDAEHVLLRKSGLGARFYSLDLPKRALKPIPALADIPPQDSYWPWRLSPSRRYLFVDNITTSDARNPKSALVVDLVTGQTWSILKIPVGQSRAGQTVWLGDERLMIHDEERMPFIINRDGTGKRELKLKD